MKKYGWQIHLLITVMVGLLAFVVVYAQNVIKGSITGRGLGIILAFFALVIAYWWEYMRDNK